VDVVDDYRRMQSTPMSFDMYRHWLEQLYTIPAKKDRPGRIEDLPRKWKQLEQAWHYGIGADIPGVRGTVYAGLNALTEVESSMKAINASNNKLHSALFGTGSLIIKKAHESALELAQ